MQEPSPNDAAAVTFGLILVAVLIVLWIVYRSAPTSCASLTKKTPRRSRKLPDRYRDWKATVVIEEIVLYANAVLRRAKINAALAEQQHLNEAIVAISALCAEAKRRLEAIELTENDRAELRGKLEQRLADLVRKAAD